jgi:hypothetical protein
LTFYSIYLVDRETPFSLEEKNYICELVEEYQRTSDIKCLPRDQKKIPWKKFQLKVEKKFGKLRSRNSIKNIWNSYKRRLAKVKRNEVNRIEDKNEIDGKGETESFPVGEIGPYTKSEKHRIKFLLNDDRNDDRNDDMDLN